MISWIKTLELLLLGDLLPDSKARRGLAGAAGAITQGHILPVNRELGMDTGGAGGGHRGFNLRPEPKLNRVQHQRYQERRHRRPGQESFGDRAVNM